MTFLPVITDKQYDEYLSGAALDKQSEADVLLNIGQHNPGYWTCMTKCMISMEMSMKDKLSSNDILMLMQLVKISMVGIYSLMDKEAERMALEKVNVKTNNN